MTPEDVAAEVENDDWIATRAFENGDRQVVVFAQTVPTDYPFEMGLDLTDLTERMSEYGYRVGFVRDSTGPEVEFVK